MNCLTNSLAKHSMVQDGSVIASYRLYNNSINVLLMQKSAKSDLLAAIGILNSIKRNALNLEVKSFNLKPW